MSDRGPRGSMPLGWLMAHLRLRCGPPLVNTLRLRLLSSSQLRLMFGLDGEGFRMPSGVRKPPKHEPAGVRRRSMGIHVLLGRGGGMADAAVRSAGNWRVRFFANRTLDGGWQWLVSGRAALTLARG